MAPAISSDSQRIIPESLSRPPVPPRPSLAPTSGRSASSGSAEDGYCPHCHLLIERQVGGRLAEGAAALPALPAARRRRAAARPTPSAEPGARGSAAGVFAHEAKRAGGEGDATKDEVRAAIRKVAEDSGQRPERLLMVDYQQRAVGRRRAARR